MAHEQLKTIDVAELMIARVQSLCTRLRCEGFPQAANDLEDDFIKLYDRLLPHLARGDLANPDVMTLADEMMRALNKVNAVTELVDLRNRIVRAYQNES